MHIVVPYQERAIEIQLRTKSMHAWALAAEDYSALMGQNLKQDGTHPIQLFLAVAADMIALQAEGQPLPEEMVRLHERRRLDALPYMQGGAR